MALRPVSDPALLARLNGPAQNSQGFTQISPADPRLPAQVESTQLGNQRTRQQMGQDAALNPLKQRALAAQIRASEVATNNAARAAEKASKGDAAKISQLRALENQIGRVRQLYKAGPGSTKGISSLMDYAPTSKNAQFNAAGAGLAEIGLGAFRVPGVGSQSDAELKAFVEANRPSASDYDTQIEEKLRNLETRLASSYEAYGIKPQGSKAPPRITPKPKAQSRVIDFNDLPE